MFENKNTVASHAGGLGSACSDDLMDRVHDLTRMTEQYAEKNVILLREIIGILERQEKERRCQSNNLVREFHRLAAIWRMDTIHISDVRERCFHPAYQQIISLGEEALPLIFEELAVAPDDWFTALKAITGVDPIPVEFQSNFEETVNGWLAWAKSNGHSLRDDSAERFPESQLEDIRGNERRHH